MIHKRLQEEDSLMVSHVHVARFTFAKPSKDWRQGLRSTNMYAARDKKRGQLQSMLESTAIPSKAAILDCAR